MLVFTEPRAQKPRRSVPAGRPGSAPRPRSDRRAASRCRAPRRSRSCRARPRRCSCAARITCACPSTLGAVKPAFARAVVVDRRAPDHGVDRVAVGQRVLQPLEHDHADALRRPCPAAAASKARQWPSGETMPPSLVEVARASAAMRTETPPASAMSHSPASRLWQARWTATSEVEQAVCTVTLGPVRFELVGDAGRDEVLLVRQDRAPNVPPTSASSGSASRLRAE